MACKKAGTRGASMHYRRKAQPFNRDDRTSAAGESRCDGAHSVAHEVSGGRVEARRGAFCSARSERGRVEAQRGAFCGERSERGRARSARTQDLTTRREATRRQITRGRVEARRGARAKRSSPRLADDENAILPCGMGEFSPTHTRKRKALGPSVFRVRSRAGGI